MNDINGKITMRQAIILLLCSTYSPSMRFIPYFTSKYAQQASWLSPIISSAVLLLLVFAFHGIYKKYHEKEVSFMDIIYIIFGKPLGKFVVFLYLIFFIVFQTYLFRIYNERLVSTTYTNIDIRVFAVIMLALIAVAIRYRLAVLARMGEIIFLLLLSIFILLTLLDIPNIDFDNLTPISSADILPVMKGSIGVTTVYVYFTFIFMFSDKIRNTSAIKKTGLHLTLFYTIVIPALIIMVTGTLNYTITQRTPHPYLATVKEISLFDTIERIESIVVAIWILSDFVLLTIFTYIVLRLMKSLFGLKDEKPFALIYLSFLFVFSLALVDSRFELDEFGELVLLPLNLFFSFAFPIIAFIVGKLRGKV